MGGLSHRTQEHTAPPPPVLLRTNPGFVLCPGSRAVAHSSAPIIEIMNLAHPTGQDWAQQTQAPVSGVLGPVPGAQPALGLGHE